MSPAWFHVLGSTLEWLRDPATWLAVLGPGAFSIGYLLRCGASRAEALGALLGVALSVGTSTLLEVDGHLELHDPGWYCYGVLVLAGFRVYLPPAGRGYALCWLVLVLSDVLSMLWLGAAYPNVRLPLGIGGAGTHDALYFKPLMLAMGLLMLETARRSHASRKQNALKAFKG